MDQGMPIRYGVDASLPVGSQAFDNMWLPIYGGEVLTAYQESNIFKPLIKTRTIETGNSAEFPKTWKLTAERHAAGQTMKGQDTPTKKVIIGLDDRPMVVPLEWDDIDELMSHFEVRAEHARQAGEALAREDDRQIAALIVNAARVTKAVTDTSPFPTGGGSLGDSDLDITATSTPSEKRAAAGAALLLIEQSLSHFNDLDVPMDSLNAAFSWQVWMAIKSFGLAYNETDLQSGMSPVFGNREIISPQFGDVGKLPARNTPLLFNGVRIWNSKNIPSGVVDTGEERYRGDFSATRGMIWHPDAVARVYKMGITTEMDRIVERGSDFFVTKMLAGGGTLREEAAIEFTNIDPQ